MKFYFKRATIKKGTFITFIPIKKEKEKLSKISNSGKFSGGLRGYFSIFRR